MVILLALSSVAGAQSTKEYIKESTKAYVTAATRDAALMASTVVIDKVLSMTEDLVVTSIADGVEDGIHNAMMKRAVAKAQADAGSEGVPVLIRMVRTSHDPALRQQAMMALAKSHDPRAVAFFEEILAR